MVKCFFLSVLLFFHDWLSTGFFMKIVCIMVYQPLVVETILRGNEKPIYCQVFQGKMRGSRVTNYHEQRFLWGSFTTLRSERVRGLTGREADR